MIAISTEGSPFGSPNKFVLDNLTHILRRATGWELAICNSFLYWKGSKTPDKAHLKVSGDFAPSATTLDIEPATVPGTMIVALMTVLRLPARTVGRRPLWRQIPLPNRQVSCKPEHGAAAGQGSRNLLSHLPQHSHFVTAVFASAL